MQLRTVKFVLAALVCMYTLVHKAMAQDIYTDRMLDTMSSSVTFRPDSSPAAIEPGHDVTLYNSRGHFTQSDEE